MPDALHLPVLESKAPVVLNHLDILIVLIQIGPFDGSVHLLNIVLVVPLVLVDSKEVGLLCEVAVDILIEPFEKLEAVVVALSFFD